MGFDMMALMNDKSKAQAAGAGKYELQKIPLAKLNPNPANEKIYEVGDVEELAQSILLAGKILQNVVVTAADENGNHTIIAGHRRRLACQKLVEDGHEEFSELPCMVMTEPDDLMQELVLIQTNSTARVLSEAEKMRQAERATAILTELKSRKQISGRVRDIVAKMLGATAAQLGRYNVISKGLTNETLRAAFESGKLGVSAAYEAARLDESGQAALAGKMEEGEKPSVRDAVEQQKKDEVAKAAEEAADTSDTRKTYEVDIKPKYKTSLTIEYEEKDGIFYAGYSYMTGTEGAGVPVNYGTPYKTAQDAIEGAMKRAKAHSEKLHKALWGSGYSVVGKPEEDEPAPQKPTTESKVAAAEAKFKSQGYNALTDCEKCKLTTRCEDCCRTCPPEKHCNVGQCHIDAEKEKEQIAREQEERIAELKSERESESQEDMHELWLMKKAMELVIRELNIKSDYKVKEADIYANGGNGLKENISRKAADLFAKMADSMEQEMESISEQVADWEEEFEQEAGEE